MSFLQREIGRARCSDVILCCVDTRGAPVAGARVSLRQVASAFHVGAWISEETRAALPLLARLGSEVLLAPSVSSGLLAECAGLGLQVTFVLSAPRAGEAFANWRERCFEDEIERAFAPDGAEDGRRTGGVPRLRGMSSGECRACAALPQKPQQRAAREPFQSDGFGSGIRGCALDVADAPAAGRAIEAAMAFLRQQAGGPVTLIGLPLPLPETISAAEEYGLCLAPSRESDGRRHAAALRRALLAAAERLEACFVHGVCAPSAEPALRPAAWRLGGAERVQADLLAELATVCMSVPGITGLFFDPLVDPPSDPAAPGLLAADLRPKRAYKVLRALFQHEWRSRASGITDAEGCFSWRGFHGTYEVTAVCPDGSLSGDRRTLQDTAGEAREWRIEAAGRG